MSDQSESDPNGNFNILSLPAGNYRVTVEAQGFKKWESPQTQLTVGDRNRITAVLQIGGSAEVVSVQGTSDAIQTEKATVETVIQVQQIRELPLADRNPLGLVGLVPGMRYLGTPNGMRTTERTVVVRRLMSSAAAPQTDLPLHADVFTSSSLLGPGTNFPWKSLRDTL